MEIFDFFLIFLIFLFLIIVFLLIRKKDNQLEALRDLERRLNDLFLSYLSQIRSSVDGTSSRMDKSISSFTRETIQLREDLKQVYEKVKAIASFQEIFKSPKLRGQWGEASLAHLLAEFFPKEFYRLQYTFSTGERVDAVIVLPNKKFLSIDAKFPTENYSKMVETDNEKEKVFFRKKFISDIKTHIENISKKYILPEEGTVDYALMYIPAEAIFHEMIFNIKEINLGEYARSKKVILTSPNTIYLTLKTIENWLKDVQISKKTEEILKRLAKIQKEAEYLAEDFKKLGIHLKNATNSYENSRKHLIFFTDRVKRLAEVKEKKKLPLVK